MAPNQRHNIPRERAAWPVGLAGIMQLKSLRRVRGRTPKAGRRCLLASGESPSTMSVGEDADASLEEKAMQKIFAHLNRFFSYKGLKAYKDKFDPTWEDRFLVYEGGVPGLVQAGLAIAKATEE